MAEVTVAEIYEALQPDSLFERFAARKAVGVAQTKDFLEMKGYQG